jgi:aldehyde:ferredoxin oxidoreductase
MKLGIVYMCAYAGKILRVDLSTGKIRLEDLNKVIARKLIGGKGYGGWLLYKELKVGIDPYSANNKLLFMTGPLTGALAFLSNRCTLVTKGPLSGGWLDSQTGGKFGPELKYAGYDGLVIEGKSEKPVYLWIDDDNVEIRDAQHLWGKSTHETDMLLKTEARDVDLEVAAIGPAGENLVRFACITNDLYRHFGRGGSGAVMGSKKLKAIAIHGTKGLEIENMTAFEKTAEEFYNYLAENKFFGWSKYGTTSLVELVDANSILPTRNFQSGSFEKAGELYAQKLFDRMMVAKHKSCFGCPVACSRFCVVKSGPYAGVAVEGPEYEIIAMLGSNVGIDDLGAIVKANLLCDLEGLDAISCGNVIAFAIECYQKGILTKEDTDGLKLDFGDPEVVFSLIEKISRREKVGDLLAEGVKRASEKLGRGSEAFAMHVKGLELPGYDARGAIGMGLAYATADRGGCHLRAFTVGDEMSGRVDRFSTEKKAEITIRRQNIRAVIDSLVVCEFLGLQDGYIKLLSIATGWDFNEKSVAEIGERIYNLARAFNIREGFSRKDDTLPKRWFYEPMPEGTAKNKLIRPEDFNKMLNEYYKLRGWDSEGRPTKEKLRGLGLEEYEG